MLDIHYSLTPGQHLLEILATQFSEAYGEKIGIENNALVFPKELATGKYAFYAIHPGLGMLLIDCVFHEAVQFIRKPVQVNYFHALSFNLSTISLAVSRHDYSGIHTGDCWNRKILYSTSEKGLTWSCPPESHIRMVVVYFTHAWLQQHYNIEDVPQSTPYINEFSMNLPLQFALDLDLEFLLLVQELLTTPAPAYMSKLYYEGSVKRLIALVASRLAYPIAPDIKLRYSEVVRLMDIIHPLKGNLQAPLPSPGELATQCFMSRSKFERLFRAIYGKNYTDFFQEEKMRKAASLLQSEWSVSDTAAAIGIPNLSQFSRTFRQFYNTTPKMYQLKVNRK